MKTHTDKLLAVTSSLLLACSLVLLAPAGCERGPEEKAAERRKEEIEHDADRAKADADDAAAVAKKKADAERDRLKREIEAQKEKEKNDAQYQKDQADRGSTPP